MKPNVALKPSVNPWWPMGKGVQKKVRPLEDNPLSGQNRKTRNKSSKEVNYKKTLLLHTCLRLKEIKIIS